MVSTKAHRLQIFHQIDIYPVLGPSLVGHSSFLQCVEDSLKAGCRIVQLRDKNISDSQLLQYACQLRSLTHKYQSLLIINDRPDICLASQADGIHIGQNDFPLLSARKILGNDVLIGVSTHCLDEALFAQKNGADSINIGPIFSTLTKPNVTPVGLDTIDTISDRISVPFTVMGGINGTNIPALIQHKAYKIGVISALLQNNNYYENALYLRKLIQKFSP